MSTWYKEPPQLTPEQRARLISSGPNAGRVREEFPPSATPEGGCMQATPHKELLAQLMDPSVPKSEREHAAAREIEGLRVLLAKTVCTWPACACVRAKSAPCAKGFSVQAISWPEFPSGGPSSGLTQCDMHDDEST